MQAMKTAGEYIMAAVLGAWVVGMALWALLAGG